MKSVSLGVLAQTAQPSLLVDDVVGKVEKMNDAEINSAIYKMQGNAYESGKSHGEGNVQGALLAIESLPIGKVVTEGKLVLKNVDLPTNSMLSDGYGVKQVDNVKLLDVKVDTNKLKVLDEISADSRPSFYVRPDGEAIPRIGYRYVDSHAPYLDDLTKTGIIPKNSNGSYFSFDKMDDYTKAPEFLQVPHDAQVRIEFDTKQVLGDVEIPKGEWGKADYLEPITKDFPEFGSGGATQATTQSQIKVDKIENIKTGDVLYEKK